MKFFYNIQPLGNRGASVIAVILMLALLTSIGVVFSSLFSTSVEESSAALTSTRAFYVAEAGREAAMGHLDASPPSSNWVWNGGYLNKSIGDGNMDVEVLQYEMRDSTLVSTAACEPFLSDLVTGVTNPARTVYITLSWQSASNMGLELYDADVTDCTNPTLSATLIASSLTTDMAETIRYRITAPAAAYTYTARVTGTAGDAYQLRIAHPDETGFSSAASCGAPVAPPNTACDRAVISLGRSHNARREIFAGFSR